MIHDKLQKGIIGVGIDLVSLKRIESLLSQVSPNRFGKRILHPKEREMLCTRFKHHREQNLLNSPLIRPERLTNTEIRDGMEIERRRIIQFFGTRWAVKEAAYKAYYGYHRKSLHFTSLLLEHQGRGVPILSYNSPLNHSNISSALENPSFLVSVSHDSDFVTAIVLLSS